MCVPCKHWKKRLFSLACQLSPFAKSESALLSICFYTLGNTCTHMKNMCARLSEMSVSIIKKSWQLILPILLYRTFCAKFPEIRTFPEDWTHREKMPPTLTAAWRRWQTRVLAVRFATFILLTSLSAVGTWGRRVVSFSLGADRDALCWLVELHDHACHVVTSRAVAACVGC